MKKLLFTFIAVVGFGVSVLHADVKLETDTPCADQWSQNFDALEAAGFGFNTALAIADLDFEQCLEDTYGQ